MADAFLYNDPKNDDGFLAIYDNRQFLDPAFWQALGKARGWDERTQECKSGCGCVPGTKYHDAGECVWVPLIPEWEVNALRYFETKLNGGHLAAFCQCLP